LNIKVYTTKAYICYRRTIHQNITFHPCQELWVYCFVRQMQQCSDNLHASETEQMTALNWNTLAILLQGKINTWLRKKEIWTIHFFIELNMKKFLNRNHKILHRPSTLDLEQLNQETKEKLKSQTHAKRKIISYKGGCKD
jgi:hypothetical protein